MYDDGDEEETSDGLKYYKMECRYLDFDGQVFGESSIHLAIVKFRGTKRISTLNALPLQYHPDPKKMKEHLVECGRKFVSMLGAHHRHCRGTAFYMKDGEVVKVSVDSRVMLDAAFFRKMNPSYTRPQPDELVKKNTDDDGWREIFAESFSERNIDQVQGNGVEPTQIEEKDLLICCPTVLGFSLGDKLWSMPESLLWCGSGHTNPVMHSGICRCRYRRHPMVLVTFRVLDDPRGTEGGYHSPGGNPFGFGPYGPIR